MSYDLYCYRPKSDTPNATEAEALIESLNADEEGGIVTTSSLVTREKLVAALVEHNPRLEPFRIDYAKIAESQNISEAEARARFRHVELNAPEGDLAVQLTVYDDHVFITIPYWYQGEAADRVFKELSGYLRVAREAAGLFAYDPQTGVAFDPAKTNLTDHEQYESIVRDLPKIAAQAASDSTKPWWKFW
jgi:hypothetical protein